MNTQNTWVGLTDEELRELEKEFHAERVRTSDEEYLIIYPGDYWQWMRAIEAKLREKNAVQGEPVAYDKTEINCFAQDLYDQKMREGKRGHYESMFHVIHQCIKKVATTPQPAVPDGDALWKAWHAVGADIAGLKFGDFVRHLSAAAPQQGEME